MNLPEYNPWMDDFNNMLTSASTVVANRKKMTYTQWLEYCQENNIKPAEWVKDWTKQLLGEE